MANNFDGNNIENRSAAEKEEDKHQSESNNYYIKELVKEKHDLDVQKAPNAARLIEEEIKKIQESGKPAHDYKYVDIYREKPVKVSVKVLVPVREHPKFNFVGKLLGPKGNSMKRLQEETMCRMAVLGKGSMKDKQKEEELRKSLDPKYAHLSDDLHVEIVALAPPAEAHARIAFALAEIRKYLIPDSNDTIRQEQLREMEIVADDRLDDRRGMPPRPGILRAPPVSGRPPVLPPAPVMRPSRPILPPPPISSARIPSARSAPPKSKVFSILDRARVAMDQSYVYESAPPPSSRDYEYTSSSSSSRYPSSDRHYSSSAVDDLYSSSRYSSYDYDDDPLPHSSHDYYDSSDYHHPIQRSVKLADEGSSRAWKSYKTTSSASSVSSRLRSAPYSRPTK